MEWKILIVEDSESNREFLSEIMSSCGKVDQAGDGQPALEKYQKALDEDKPYHLILLDIELPGMSGLEFLQQVRNMEEENGGEIEDRVRIIMVTSHKKYFAEAFLKGCDDYVLKPIDSIQLIEKVKGYLVEPN